MNQDDMGHEPEQTWAEAQGERQTDFPFRGKPASYWYGWLDSVRRTSPTLDATQRRTFASLLNTLWLNLEEATTCDTTKHQHALVAAIFAYCEALGEVE